MPKNINEHIGALCEVNSSVSNTFAVGSISNVEKDFINIGKEKYDLPIFQQNEEIKCTLRGDEEILIYSGKVFSSNPNVLVLSNIKRIVTKNRRRFFRLNVSIPTDIMLIDEEHSKIPENNGKIIFEKSYLNKLEEIYAVIKDLSLCGASIEVKHDFKEGDHLILKVPLSDKEEIYLYCIVVRKSTLRGANQDTFRYGCELVANNPASSEKLCSFIMQTQRNMIAALNKAPNNYKNTESVN